MGHAKLTNRSFDRPAAKLDPRRHFTIAGKIAQFETMGLKAGTKEMAEALAKAGFTQAAIDEATEVRG